jgi:hypothetical protein
LGRNGGKHAGLLRRDQRGIVNLSGTYVVWQSGGMETPPATKKYTNHRCPVEISSHAVWLYLRFCLSFRAVEKYCGNVGESCPMRLFAKGAASLANRMPTNRGAAARGRGVWKKVGELALS